MRGRARGAALPLLLLLLPLLLVPFPAAVAQAYDFKVAPLADATARPGREWETTVSLAHTCPATGVARVLVQGDDSVEGHAEDAAWGECGADGYARATSTLRVTVLPNATAGTHALAVAGYWEGHVSRATTMKITVAYVASATVEAPRESVVLPGRAVEVPLQIRIVANADTWLVFSTDAPDDWTVDGARPIDVRVTDGAADVAHRLRFTTSEDGFGDVPVTISAIPFDALTHREQGGAGAARWTARLPPRLERDEASAPPPTGRTGDAGPLPDAAPPAAPRETPAWVIALGLVAAGGLAFAWTRRKG